MNILVKPIILTNRVIKVVLNDQNSRSFSINVTIPQASILGSSMFLIFINDLSDDTRSQLGIHADETTIFSCLSIKPVRSSKINLVTVSLKGPQEVANWKKKCLVNDNALITKLLLLKKKRTEIIFWLPAWQLLNPR